jgi:hypothetical protein
MHEKDEGAEEANRSAEGAKEEERGKRPQLLARRDNTGMIQA